MLRAFVVSDRSAQDYESWALELRAQELRRQRLSALQLGVEFGARLGVMGNTVEDGVNNTNRIQPVSIRALSWGPLMGPLGFSSCSMVLSA